MPCGWQAMPPALKAAGNEKGTARNSTYTIPPSRNVIFVAEAGAVRGLEHGARQPEGPVGLARSQGHRTLQLQA